jgi:4-diphosphocytidyl-2-C-methyl-D-erythritol kinase
VTGDLTITKGSRSPAGWPAAPPTRRPRWSRSTGSGPADLRRRPAALAAELGSDVPFALFGGTALGTGRGELVEPVDDAAHLVVGRRARDAEGLSTPAVYRHFDELAPTPRRRPHRRACSPPSPPVTRALAAALHNDLQAAALDLRPELGDLIELGEAGGALRGLVSGSGPTVSSSAPPPTRRADVAGDSRSTTGARVARRQRPVAGAHLVNGL